MSKTNNLHDYLADLYQGIASKKPNASKNPQNFRAEIEALGSIGGINGVVEQYTVNAGATVTAGDFVEFVNTWNKGEIISVNPTEMAACKLDNTRVLIAYAYSAPDGKRLHAQVVSIEDNKIVEGEPIVLYSGTNSYVRAIALTDNMAVVSYKNGNAGAWIRCGQVELLSIEGSAVKLIDSKELGNEFSWSDMVALTDNTFLVMHASKATSSSTGRSGYVEAFSVNDGKLNQIQSLNFCPHTIALSVYDRIVPIKLSPTKVLLVFQADKGEDYIHYCVIGFENGNLTKGEIAELVGITTDQYVGCALDENTVICVIQNDICLVNVDGTKVTSVIDGGDVHTVKAISYPSITPISNTQAVVAYKVTSEGKSYVSVVTVSGDKLNVGTPIVFDEGDVDINQLIAFSDNSVVNIFANEFIAGVGMTVDGDNITLNQLTSTYVQPATSRLHNVGVAKTAGSAGEKIDVYVVGEA